VFGWSRAKCSACSQTGMNQIVGPLACLAITMALAACSADEGSELRADFLSRFEQPTTGITSCPVFAVHLQDRTAGRPTAWEWTFGDGSTSSEQNPTRDTNAVVAEVTLTASRGDVEDSVTKVISTPEAEHGVLRLRRARFANLARVVLCDRPTGDGRPWRATGVHVVRMHEERALSGKVWFLTGCSRGSGRAWEASARSSGVPAARDPRFTHARRRGGPRSSTGECRVGGTSDACRV